MTQLTSNEFKRLKIILGKYCYEDSSGRFYSVKGMHELNLTGYVSKTRKRSSEVINYDGVSAKQIEMMII